MKLLMAFLFLGLGCCPVEVFGLPPAKILYVTGNPDADSSPATVWSMDSSGAIRSLKTLPSGRGGILGIGSVSPIPAPDGQKVAYLKKGNIWIWDIAHQRSFQASHEGFPGDDNYWGVEVLITSWSPDSRQLLYYIFQDDGDLNEGQAEPKTRKIPYGYLVFSLKTHKSKSIPIKGNILGWNKAGELLYKTPREDGTTLEAVDGNGKVRKIFEDLRINELNFCYVAKDGQEFFSFTKDDGKALATAGQFTQWLRLIEIDLLTGVAREIAKKDDWATRYRAPTYSPGVNRVAWMNGKWEGGIARSEKLLVDGKVVFQSPVNFGYQWIDDERVAVETDKELMVLSIGEGRILGRHPLAPDK